MLVLCFMCVYCILSAFSWPFSSFPMPAVLLCLEDAHKYRSTIQERTLISAAIDSWLPNQLNRNDGSHLASAIRLDRPEPARTSVLSSIKRQTFHATKSLNALLVPKWTGGSAAIRRASKPIGAATVQMRQCTFGWSLLSSSRTARIL